MTDKQPTDAEVKEFWEWCGFKLLHEPYTPIHCAELQYPDGHKEEWDGWLAIDLNNLCRWAVPKLLSWEIESDPLDKTKTFACVNYNHPNGFEGYEAYNYDSALALFWAINGFLSDNQGGKP